MNSSPTVLHYDSFSSVPNMGNPAGVVLNADGMTDSEMQDIANSVGFNETSFVMSSDLANYHIRFFTPGHEMPLCGHAILACTLALVETKGSVSNSADFVFETLAGLIEATYQLDDQTGKPIISMKQTPAKFVEFTGSRQELTNALGVEVTDLHPTLPIVYGNTGNWTLLVPMVTKDSIRRMQPSTAEFPNVLHQIPRCSVHPFALDVVHPDSDMHARHFSSPFSGTIEDPVTGTASGVMGAYMAKYQPSFYNGKNGIAVVEQGFDVGRDGRVTVELLSEKDPILVKISGSAVCIGVL